MFVLGLTGLTGAGKSTVARMLEEEGACVLDCDKIARKATEKGSPCLRDLSEAFGADILRENGELDRTLLAKRAFSGPEKVGMLNRLTHPFICRLIEDDLYNKEQAGVPVIVLDAPQLFEAGCERYCGAVCVVTAPAEVRMQRLEQRDGLPRELLEKRMQAQLSEDFLREKADFVIDGSQPLSDVHHQVQKVWRACCRIAGC